MVMGCCFSSFTTTAATKSRHPPTAKVIALDGSLIEYAVPVSASHVLGADHSSCFLCDSNKLFFEANIPALHAGHPLEPDQIYFVLPVARLEYPLSCEDMGALARKASSAIAGASRKHGGRGRRIRVAPVSEVHEGVDDEELKRFDKHHQVGVSGLKTAGKVAMRRRPGMVARPYIRRLSTIKEVYHFPNPSSYFLGVRERC